MATPIPPSEANTLRRRVTRSLDHPLGSASHGNIDAQLDRFEQVLLALCTQAVLDVLDEEGKPAGAGVHLLHIAGRAMVLKLRPDLQRERTLRMSLQDVASPDLSCSRVYVDHRADLDNSIGRFDTICLTVPCEFEDEFLSGVRDRLLVTLNTGYAVLERRAATALAAMQTSFDRAVADTLREPVAGLGDGVVWPLLVTKQRVCLMVTPEVIRRVLCRARALNDPVLAPVQWAYRVLADSCPLPVAIRQALHTGDSVTFETSDAETDAEVLLRDDLLGRLFDPGAGVSALPLAVVDRMSILVACPAWAAAGVTEALTPLRDVLVRLAEKY